MMKRHTPPFRADHVGSLLRPAALKTARAEHERGAIAAADLRAVEDREIERIIGRQEALGLAAVTDGEFRRGAWHRDFFLGLDGIAPTTGQPPIGFRGIDAPALNMKIAGKIGFSDSHPFLAHFRYLADHAEVTAKITIPSPSVLAPATLPDTGAYRDLEALYFDMGAAYQAAIHAFAAAGCTYLQIDEVRMVSWTDPTYRARTGIAEADPVAHLKVYAGILNHALRDRPAGMTIAMHNCRGNFRSHWVAEGGYEPIADLLFNGIGIDAYFLEYDSARAGGFEPLRLLPHDKIAVLGLVTTKTGKLEAKDEIKRRLDEAGKFIDLDRVCLSPQCGFASTEEGNELAEDEQWAKLAFVKEIADEVWG
jgi:5-methyltetrahydropteroyltriglutamate--homocysteine methyltransferase